MSNLKWVGAAAAVLGVVFLFFALLWTEWPQLLAGVGLLLLGAVLWRAFAGDWPTTTRSGT